MIPEYHGAEGESVAPKALRETLRQKDRGEDDCSGYSPGYIQSLSFVTFGLLVHATLKACHSEYLSLLIKCHKATNASLQTDISFPPPY